MLRVVCVGFVRPEERCSCAPYELGATRCVHVPRATPRRVRCTPQVKTLKENGFDAVCFEAAAKDEFGGTFTSKVRSKRSALLAAAKGHTTECWHSQRWGLHSTQSTVHRNKRRLTCCCRCAAAAAAAAAWAWACTQKPGLRRCAAGQLALHHALLRLPHHGRHRPPVARRLRRVPQAVLRPL